jgi:hypothetical protein
MRIIGIAFKPPAGNTTVGRRKLADFVWRHNPTIHGVGA